ncbi:hypothetical protein [Teichococcus aestuarii]|uniref:hypothetical protein n=1 Tax=Teichococcus aestuarii TaxID=568898 RepID=UPI00360BF3B3
MTSTRYAHVVDGVVRSLYQRPDTFADLPLDALMAPEIAAQMAPLPEDQASQVLEGWRCEAGTFLPPLPPEAPPPTPIRVITPRQFRLRFTLAERGAITLAASRALAAGDATLQVFLDDLAASQEVELDHPDLAAGVQALVTAGLIDAARAAEILSVSA